jgi:predicted metal-dependent peptidase
MRQPLPPKVTVIMDTSPSMSRELLRDGLSEILGIVRAVGASQSVTVIPCSGKAFPSQEVKRASQVKNLDLKGDKSTNLVRGFVAALEERKKPKIIVVITDGYTPWPKDKPKGVDLVIILLTVDDAVDSIPKWAKAILIPD